MVTVIMHRQVCVCSRAENKNERSREHVCFKNRNASSGAMESDLIMEGFNENIATHNVRYLKFISYGKSSVFVKIREKVVYGTEVMKIHCTNHAVKNCGKALYKIRNETSVAVSGRKLLTAKNIKALQDIEMKVLSINAHGLVEDLKADLLNGPNHVTKDVVKIEVHTKGQWDNPRYVMERKGRLTASRFGKVCKRRINRKPHALVAQILYPKHFTNEAVNYGKVKEKVTIAQFPSARKVQIDDSEMFVDEQHPYLGASPDATNSCNLMS
ncbi:hypothetical protein ILUMI_26591 [Ignelater luminosus]|uniref:Uncharacterized protein n=1 Tax=Ignelater luminosus TaxID=2038154 RepID=A0A8K0C6D1_IGNLU|nr:hypothetical protein ILUMI_26591 [Ignelater luminosus]